jgi:CheY-like chemotaxis protein
MESKKKILIVDDDSLLLDMYALKFSNSDFDVTACLGSEAALNKLLSGFIPDVMVVDVVMPVMDGFELLEKIKENNLASSAIFIVLSNQGQKSDVDRSLELGVAGYIVKATSTPSEVISKVCDIINNNTNK